MVRGVTTREHVIEGVLRKEFGKCSAWRFVNAAGIAAARATGGVEVPVAASGSDQGKKDGVFVRGRQQEVPVGSEPQARSPSCPVVVGRSPFHDAGAGVYTGACCGHKVSTRHWA